MGGKETDNLENSFKKSLTIRELGIEIVFGKEEPLRTSGLLTGLDLLGTANRLGYQQDELEHVLTNQLAIAELGFKDYMEPFITRKVKKKAQGILYKGESLPFFIGHTTKAIMDFNLSEMIDSRKFISNYDRFIPKREELERHNISSDDVSKMFQTPAILSGSAALFYWDGIDENTTFLRERQEGLYEGFYNIAGGTADGPEDITGLAELKEEMVLPDNIISRTKPLGVYDQALIRDGHLGRYLNVVWEAEIDHDTWPGEGDGGGRWRETWDSEAFMFANEKRLTPIAEYALRTAKFI